MWSPASKSSWTLQTHVPRWKTPESQRACCASTRGTLHVRCTCIVATLPSSGLKGAEPCPTCPQHRSICSLHARATVGSQPERVARPQHRCCTFVSASKVRRLWSAAGGASSQTTARQSMPNPHIECLHVVAPQCDHTLSKTAAAVSLHGRHGHGPPLHALFSCDRQPPSPASSEASAELYMAIHARSWRSGTVCHAIAQPDFFINTT